MLKVRRLNKSFGGTKVLKDISFEIESGEVCVLLGKSGAGKTTILRDIAKNLSNGMYFKTLIYFLICQS